MASCGVWATARRLVACPVDDDGATVAPAFSCARGDEGCWQLLAQVEALLGLDCVFVVSQALVATEPLVRIASARGSQVRVASDALVLAARSLVGLERATPRRLALLLARMPLCLPMAQRLVAVETQLKLF